MVRDERKFFFVFVFFRSLSLTSRSWPKALTFTMRTENWRAYFSSNLMHHLCPWVDIADLFLSIILVIIQCATYEIFYSSIVFLHFVFPSMLSVQNVLRWMWLNIKQATIYCERKCSSINDETIVKENRNKSIEFFE